MRKEPRGLTINYSSVTNENGEQEIGFRYNDTDGIDIDRHYTGMREEDIFTQLCCDVLDDMEKQTTAIKEAKEKKALEEKKKAEAAKKKEATRRTTMNYEQIIEELQEKLAAARQENQSLKLDNEVLNQRIKDNLKKPEKSVKKENKKPEEKYNPYKMLEEIFTDYPEEGWSKNFWDNIFK